MQSLRLRVDFSEGTFVGRAGCARLRGRRELLYSGFLPGELAATGTHARPALVQVGGNFQTDRSRGQLSSYGTHQHHLTHRPFLLETLSALALGPPVLVPPAAESSALSPLSTLSLWVTSAGSTALMSPYYS